MEVIHVRIMYVKINAFAKDRVLNFSNLNEFDKK